MSAKRVYPKKCFLYTDSYIKLDTIAEYLKNVFYILNPLPNLKRVLKRLSIKNVFYILNPIQNLKRMLKGLTIKKTRFIF